MKNYTISILKNCFLSGVILCLTGTLIYAQEIRSDRLDIVGEVHPIDLEDIKLSVEGAYAQYRQYASLKGNSGTVDSEGQKNFMELFTNNAEIGNDIEETSYGVLMSSFQYSNVLGGELREQGLEFDLSNPYYRVLTYDPDGYYTMEVRVNKRIYNSLDKNNEPARCKKGRLFVIDLYFEIFEDDFQDVSIKKIVTKLEEDCDDSEISVTVGGRFGIGLGDVEPDLAFNYVNSLALPSSNGPLTVVQTGIQSISFGAMVNFAPFQKKEINLHAGIQIAQYSFEYQIQNQYEMEELGGNKLLDRHQNEYTQVVMFGNDFTDEYQYTALEIPIGLSYQYNLTNDLSFVPRLMVIPTLGISSTSSLSGDIEYQGVYNYTSEIEATDIPWQWSQWSDVPEMNYNTYSFADNEDYYDDNDLETSLSIAASVGLYFRATISEKMQIIFGPDYRFYVTSIFEHRDPLSGYFQLDNSNSAAQAFTQYNNAEDLPNQTPFVTDQVEEATINNLGFFLGLNLQLK